ncbi:MAG: copper chaperone PCu(A)C [Lysobacterales bacterium]
MNAYRLVAGLALSFALPSLAACARDGGDASCAPRVRDGCRCGWCPAACRCTRGSAASKNACAAPATIVSASSPSYGSVMLHESRIVGGVNQMRMLQELRLKPDDAAVLKPGGLHLMLMDPTSPLKPGSHVAIDFALKDGRHVLGDFEVRNAQP